MKQTAIEWFAKELYEKFEMKGDGNLFDEIFIHYKEMEKQQIIDAYNNGQQIPPFEYAEQYYNETFKNK